MCDALRYFKDEEYVGIFALNESRYIYLQPKKSSLEKILIQPFSGKIGASLISRYISAHTRLGRPVSRSMYVLSSGKCSYARLWHGGLK